MVSEKIEFDCSRDLISELPDVLKSHILSFLPTREAASTSVLSRKWRYLFAFTPNLDFDNHKRNKVSTSFMDFVDRVLALQGNSPVHKFSLKVRDNSDDPVVPNRIFPWILNVLERGVSDLNLSMELESESLLPSKIFLSETLVTLKLAVGYGPTIEVDDVYLPKLKTLSLDVIFGRSGIGLSQLLSRCHVLEELVLHDMCWCIWNFSSVSVPTLKRLTFCWEERDEIRESVSIDTPSLVYLEFTDTIADKYPKLNFDSLVEARICLRMSEEQIGKVLFLEEASFSDLEIYYAEGHDENEMAGDATDFFVGICNVQILYLYADTIELLTYCCEEIPVFNNLRELTIESNPKTGWDSLPGLLKNAPNLETLVFQGLVHNATDRCGDVCLCETYGEEEEEEEEEEEGEEEEEEIPSCLLSSPVKVLKIMMFGDYYGNMGKQSEQIKYFLETMPNLEQMILRYNAPTDEHVIEVSKQLERIVSRVASSNCVVQLSSDNLSLSATVLKNGLLLFRRIFV